MVKQLEVINAVSYERVSSEEQAREGFSLEVQHEKNTNHIHNQGWNFIRSYVDPGKSGKDLKRPDVQRLLTDLKKGDFNCIVIHKLDRLTRNIGDLHYLLNLFDQHDIKLVSISENLDTNTAMGRMFIYMLGIFAQWYRENLSEEVVKGQTKRAEKGLRNSSAKPYGYDVIEDNELIVNVDEADIVKKIFNWYVQGHGLNKIATFLNEDFRIPSPGGSIWRERNIAYIIDNPTYIGFNHWEHEQKIVAPGNQEPLIPKDTFELAQKIRIKKKENEMNQSSYEFAFSTIVKCGECGRSYHGKMITREKGKTDKNYRCSGKYRQDKCRASDVYGTKLDRLILNFVNNIILEPNEPEKLVSNNKDVSKEIKKLEKFISDSAAKRKNYSRAMGDKKITYEEFSDLIEEENAKVLGWQNELEQLRLLVGDNTAKNRRDKLQRLISLRDEWQHLTEQQRKFTLQLLFKFIVIKKLDKEWSVIAYKLLE